MAGKMALGINYSLTRERIGKDLYLPKAGWAWRPACNSNLQKANQGIPRASWLVILWQLRENSGFKRETPEEEGEQ